MKRALALAVALSACTPAAMRRDLRYVAGFTEVAAQGSLACDWGSTNHAMDAGYQESNPVMGSHPGHSVTAAYFVGVAGAVAIYNRVLPDVLRVVANVVVVGVEYDAISFNHQSGADPHGCGL